jgi:hypothetical protein
MLAILLFAAADPLPRVGTCPLGYYSSGSYCVPTSGSSQRAIEKQGMSCPLGWYSSAGYCVKFR